MNYDGYMLPSCIESEFATIGFCLQNPAKFPEVFAALPSSEYFYNADCNAIYAAMVEIYQKGGEIEPISVRVKSKVDRKIIETHSMYRGYIAVNPAIEKLLDNFVRRKSIKIANEILNNSFQNENDIKKTLINSINDFEAVLSKKNNSVVLIHQSMTEVVAKLQKTIKNKQSGINDITGVDTGFEKLNHAIGGWQPTDFIVIAARPAMGKSAFALNTARQSFYVQNKKTLFFSLEMSATQLASRQISDLANINNRKLRTADIDSYEMVAIQQQVDLVAQKDNLFIDESGGLTVEDIRYRAKEYKRKHNIELIIVDYLQIVKPSTKGNREQEISHIARGLKALAKELDIPVIALAQLGRAVEQRSDKIPLLSDLRESGSIEQEADIVIFLSRPEYYGINEIRVENDLINATNKSWLICAKNRHGDTFKTLIDFTPEYTRFSDGNSRTLPQQNIIQDRAYEDPFGRHFDEANIEEDF